MYIIFQMNVNECPLCFHKYKNLEELQLHVIECRNKKKSHTCQFCNKKFSRKYCLDRHLSQNRCRVAQGFVITNGQKLQLKKKIVSKVSELEKQLAEKDKQIAELKNNETLERLEKMEKRLDEKDQEMEQNKKEIAELKENPRISNQILQVVCIGNNDNYLDMLTTEWNSFDKALEYIKDCALSSLTGDCKLIEKMYLGDRNTEQPAIRFLDKNRTKIEYFNEKKEKISDSKEIFGKKIANNLQNSYLKGINYLLTKNLENHMCPNKFLEEYDLQLWNQHIYDLSDLRYHRKIINQLNIPIGGSPLDQRKLHCPHDPM